MADRAIRDAAALIESLRAGDLIPADEVSELGRHVANRAAEIQKTREADQSQEANSDAARNRDER
jgi:hypothetical protein